MTPFGMVSFGCMLSVGTIRFEDRFCASRRVGDKGRVPLWVTQCIAAIAAAYRKALVDAGWAISLSLHKWA